MRRTNALPMQTPPANCLCPGHHALHCGDCGGPARAVKVRERGVTERTVVCLNVDGCGHIWGPR